MNDLLKMLAGGDLRSDGRADDVAEIVQNNLSLFPDLLVGLDEKDDVIRGRSAHALEKISRNYPEIIRSHLEYLMERAANDETAMVRWHLAMVFGNLALVLEDTLKTLPTLYQMLEDQSVFVASWAISSLTIIGRLYPMTRDEIVFHLSPLLKGRSTAIRTRTEKAILALGDNQINIPESWIKNERLKDFI